MNVTVLEKLPPTKKFGGLLPFPVITPSNNNFSVTNNSLLRNPDFFGFQSKYKRNCARGK